MLIVVIAAAMLVSMAGLVLVRALRFTPRESRVAPAAPLDLDVKAAVERLAEALRFPTVSPENPGATDLRPFREFHDFLAMAYPNVHRALAREVVNGGSLLYVDDHQKARNLRPAGREAVALGPRLR